MDFNVHDLLTLSAIPGIGPNRLRALVSHFKDPHLVTTAGAKELAAVDGIDKKMAQAIVRFFRASDYGDVKRSVDDQLSRLNRINGRLVTYWDRNYPENLKRIYDPPPYLFVRGPLHQDTKYSIAIVGTRSPSPYGVNMTERFSHDLAALGIPIVSGLARGIDTRAHHAALKANGRTLAVVGSGVDIIYPPENRQLFEHIIEDGAVVSEFAMGTKPDAGNFPRRNRIISGIALGTVIIETGLDGGAMITASTALDQNREVFAVPSAVSDKRVSGTNLLIKEGKALLTETVEDILNELRPRLKGVLKTGGERRTVGLPPLSLFEQQLYEAMQEEPIHVDVLSERAGLTTSDALVHLLSMEFKGVVRQMPGKMFLRTQ